jgi:hypothetical protein
VAYLDELARLSTDVLQKGVIETIIKDSPILQNLPFIEIEGNSLKYNREKTLPYVAWRTAGSEWTGAETFELSPQTAYLYILGGDADVDAFYQKTRSNVQDIEAAVIEQKAKAVRHAFEDAFINGNYPNAQTDRFHGLIKLCIGSGSASNPEHGFLAGANGAPLTLDMVDQLIDTVEGPKPDMILTSRRVRRELNALIRASGALAETSKDKVGNFVQLYNGIPVYVNDWVATNHEYGSSGTVCSYIFALRVGEDALCGLQNGGIQVEKIGNLESYDASRIRIKWYCGLALFSQVAIAMISAITPP